jgi:hypothetical protein
MNKVMNNFRILGKSIIFQLVNENVKIPKLILISFRNAREIKDSGVFFYSIHKEVYKELTKNLPLKKSHSLTDMWRVRFSF